MDTHYFSLVAMALSGVVSVMSVVIGFWVKKYIADHDLAIKNMTNDISDLKTKVDVSCSEHRTIENNAERMAMMIQTITASLNDVHLQMAGKANGIASSEKIAVLEKDQIRSDAAVGELERDMQEMKGAIRHLNEMFERFIITKHFGDSKEIINGHRG